jgi:D-alanyl-lipoteichoic acid acyltransferase DltB (MBOAT superfamily)
MKKERKKKRKIKSKEVWMRIPVFIISGIILYVWGFFVLCFCLAQFILILVDDKKNKELVHMCRLFNIQAYDFMNYITFVSERRPFPFGHLQKSVPDLIE